MENVLDTLANEMLEAQIALEEAKERFEEAKEAFIAEATKQGKWNTSLKAAGNARLKISRNRRFDTKIAEGLVTKKVIKECTVPTLDAKLLKNHLTPIQLEECMVDYTQPFKMSVSVLDD